MLAAIGLFESNNNQNIAAQHAGVSQARIAYANVVLDYAPKLVDLVIADDMGLDEAYAEAVSLRG